MKKFEHKSYSSAKIDAQENLNGLTHYVDNETLKYFGSRINQTFILGDGLLFGLIESVYLTYKKTSRGFRFVIFDITGNVVERADLDSTYSSAKSAKKYMYEYLETVDPKEITKKALQDKKKYLLRDIEKIDEDINSLS